MKYGNNVNLGDAILLKPACGISWSSGGIREHGGSETGTAKSKLWWRVTNQGLAVTDILGPTWVLGYVPLCLNPSPASSDGSRDPLIRTT